MAHKRANGYIKNVSLLNKGFLPVMPHGGGQLPKCFINTPPLKKKKQKKHLPPPPFSQRCKIFT